MRRFTHSGRQAIADGNLYAALSLALMIPDICGSLEDPGPGKSRARYERWCKSWVEPKFTSYIGSDSTPHVFVSAGNCYQLRCSLIHSGSGEIDPSKVKDISRFAFFDESTGNHLNWFGSVVLNGVAQGGFLQLRAAAFSETLYGAAEEWDDSVASDERIQQEKAKLLLIHSRGSIVQGVMFE